MTDDMLIKLAPKFGVQLPPELQRIADSTRTASSSSSSGSSSRSSGSGKATVFFPGDFKMDAA
jgi:hypothetical protein